MKRLFILLCALISSAISAQQFVLKTHIEVAGNNYDHIVQFDENNQAILEIDGYLISFALDAQSLHAHVQKDGADVALTGTEVDTRTVIIKSQEEIPAFVAQITVEETQE